jgi:hypothetical protein
MATETETEADAGLAEHVRGVTVTTLAGLAGVAAALASTVVVGATPAAARNPRAVFVLAAFVAVQYPLLRAVGVDVGDFGVKDHLYVSFMTFALWFVSYAILLTNEVAL